MICFPHDCGIGETIFGVVPLFSLWAAYWHKHGGILGDTFYVQQWLLFQPFGPTLKLRPFMWSITASLNPFTGWVFPRFHLDGDAFARFWWPVQRSHLLETCPLEVANNLVYDDCYF